MTPKGTLNYLVGTKILKHTTVDKKYFVFGYDTKQNRLYLIDKSLNMISSTLLLPLVNFQAAVLSEDMHYAEQHFKDIPQSYHSKVAKFLEAQGQKEMAFTITPDPDHKFDLALSLNKI